MAGGRLRLGCLGGLIFGVAVVVGVYALIVPWSFHIGNRWTPFATWSGVGRLQDSSGAQYGLYAWFFPNFRGASRLGKRWNTGLRGKAWVCTAGGTKYQFELRGNIYQGWSDSDGKEMSLNLQEPRSTGLRRHFTLYGSFHGPDLLLDDRKTMFMYIQPGGALAPTRSYTSPVPEKHANVTLSWGSRGDFDNLCATLGQAPR